VKYNFDDLNTKAAMIPLAIQNTANAVSVLRTFFIYSHTSILSLKVGQESVPRLCLLICYDSFVNYPNNDLWSVRQIEFLQDALDGYENKSVVYYPEKLASLEVPGIATYSYCGVLHFPGQDRTILFEQGEGFGLKKEEILAYLSQKGIKVEEITEVR
jgi:hypothetical protein